MFKYSVYLGLYIGYSTDTRPANVDAGTLIYEYDTGDAYMWTGTEWKIV